MISNLVVAVTLAVGGVATPAPAVEWTKCDRPELPVAEGVECGRLSVPVDWARPSAGTVKVRVYRWKAPDSKGTFLNFPSGPGSPGDLAMGSIRRALPGYDVIGLDPRGVGDSAPLTCDTRKALAIPYVPPVDAGAFDALRSNQKDFWASCRTDAPGLKLDAYSNARDAEALRKALGLGQINVYGFSYGTLLAERYLALFGQQVNASVLEGVMNPAQSRREMVTSAAAGVEAIFTRFTQWCAAESSCALHSADVAEVFRTAQRNAETGRVPGTLHGFPWSAVMVTRYFELAGPSDFSRAAKGLFDLSEGRNPEPDRDTGEIPPRFPYTDPIVCSDFPLSVRTPAQARGDVAATREAAPVTGFSTNTSNYTSICLEGPRPVAAASLPVSSRSANPALLLSNTLDQATPVRWADQVAKQLGDKAVQVRVEAVGHGGAFDDPGALAKVREYVGRVNHLV